MREVRRERGAALLILLTMVILASASVLLAHGPHLARTRAHSEETTTRALAEAKQALIGWAVAYPAASNVVGDSPAPGVLPFPDRAADGDYDGFADCFSLRAVPVGGAFPYLLGRLPYRGEGPGCKVTSAVMDAYFVDGAGEPLWYAVSRNVVNFRGGSRNSDPTDNHSDSLDNPINPGLLDSTPEFPWIRVVDGDGNVLTDAAGNDLEIAAVIIAPGRALGTQDRSAAAPVPAQFLDAVSVGTGVTARTVDNSDSDGCQDDVVGCLAGEEFIVRMDSLLTEDLDDAFNDRLVYITAEELIRATEGRVLGEVSTALQNCSLDLLNGAASPCGNGQYPWLAPLADPDTAAFAAGAVGTTSGHLPLLHRAGQTYTSDYSLTWTPATGGTYNPTVSVGFLGAGPSEAFLRTYVNGPHAFTDHACTWESNVADAVDGIDEVVCTGSSPAQVVYTVPSGFFPYRITVNVSAPDTGLTGSSTVTAAATASVKRTRAVSATTAQLTTPLTVTVSGYRYFVLNPSFRTNESRLTVTETDPPATTPVVVSGLEYDLDVLRGEVPQWLVDNQWHHYIEVAAASSRLPGGGATCTAGVDCLTVVLPSGSVDDVHALAVSPGRQLAGQDRAGNPGSVASYLDPPNNTIANDLFDRLAATSTFNDQLRVVGSNAGGYR